MTPIKTYRRKLPFFVKARFVDDPQEVIYDGQGNIILAQEGDAIIHLETDKFKLDRGLFDQLYEEIESESNGNKQK